MFHGHTQLITQMFHTEHNLSHKNCAYSRPFNQLRNFILWAEFVYFSNLWLSVFNATMSRQTMFDMTENSIDLNHNAPDGLQTIDEDAEARRELSAHEKKEFDRSKLFCIISFKV
jgi:hypothetical protein